MKYFERPRNWIVGVLPYYGLLEHACNMARLLSGPRSKRVRVRLARPGEVR